MNGEINFIQPQSRGQEIVFHLLNNSLQLPLSAALTAVVETPRRVAAKTDRQTNEAIFSVRVKRYRQSERVKQMTNEQGNNRRTQSK